MELRTRAGLTPQPKTLNEKDRTVQAVLATDAPARVFDVNRGVIDEVLVMRGFKPAKETIPMLDNHRRDSVGNILGSITDFKVDDHQVSATLRFAATDDGEAAFSFRVLGWGVNPALVRSSIVSFS